jgi:DNA-binding MarR family transcriptional regulator
VSTPSDHDQAQRQHVGQLLVHLTRLFQSELYVRLQDAGLRDARVPHTHVTAHIKAEGSRLTDLAAQARMTRPAMAELVDDLERLGIVERRPDPSDGRAKLVCLTNAGWDAMRTGRRVITELETKYAQLIGAQRFEQTCQGMQALLDALTSEAHSERPR